MNIMNIILTIIDWKASYSYNCHGHIISVGHVTNWIYLANCYRGLICIVRFYSIWWELVTWKSCEWTYIDVSPAIFFIKLGGMNHPHKFSGEKNIFRENGSHKNCPREKHINVWETSREDHEKFLTRTICMRYSLQELCEKFLIWFSFIIYHENSL